ncbi:unnamed protein product [Aphanomyces euteiches]|nr:hypothetical protein AeRB84_013918 [Aphanomyces euteiches]
MRQVEKLAKALVPVLHGNVDKESADAHATHIKQVIQDLLASPSLLIKPTQRIAKIKKAEEVLSMDHHIKAATSFFATFHEFQEDTCVSLLLAKLLIALGEGVVYLDETIPPRIGKRLAVIDKDCCLNLWQPSLGTFLKANNGGQTVMNVLRAFRGDPKDSSNFDTLLQETAKLALRLQDALNIPTEVIEGAFGLNLDDEEQTKDKIGDFLFGLFGGVPGYVAELFVALTRKNVALISYMAALKSYVHDIVEKELGVNIVENAGLWLKTMKQVTDPWWFAREAGLCGSTPPRGVILRYMLEALFFFAPQDDEVETVKCFRSCLQDDHVRAPLTNLEGEQWVPEAEETAQVESVKKRQSTEEPRQPVERKKPRSDNGRQEAANDKENE